MTIALGILGTKCLVVAADTQETDGITKGFSLKVNHASKYDANLDVKGSIVISGAGNSGYIESVSESLIDLFLEREDWSITEFEMEMKSKISVFYREHVVPLSGSSYPPDVALVIGFQNVSGSQLWATEKSTTRRGLCEAAGVGSMQAKLLVPVNLVRRDIATAVLVAIYGVKHVKKHVEGCGDHTTVVCLANNAVHQIPMPIIRDAEKAFDGFWATSYGALQFVIGNESLPEEHVARVSTWMTELRNDCNKLRDQINKHTGYKTTPSIPRKSENQ
jgi:hypothetical protein